MKNIKPGKAYIYSAILFGIGAMTALIGTELHIAVCIVGMVIAFAGLILHVVKYRCPHCNAYLRRSPVPHYCPCCGKEIKE